MRLDILKPFIISIVALSWSISLCGQGLERAKELYKAGKFAEAKPIFGKYSKESFQLEFEPMVWSLSF